VIARLAPLAALAALALGAGPASARPPGPPGGGAPPPSALAILAVDASSADVARSFESGLEARLAAARAWFVPRGRLREQLRRSAKWTDGCVVGGCLAEVRAQTGADVVLLASLTGSGTTFGYVITLVRTDTGRVLAQASERCDVCTEAEATAGALGAAVRLVGAIPDRLPDEAAERGAAVEIAVNAVNRERAAERRGVRRVGWALTLVGLAAAGTGAFLYLAGDERPAYGLATAAAGGGLALGGLTVLVF
jgi:hypothetical protein